MSPWSLSAYDWAVNRRFRVHARRAHLLRWPAEVPPMTKFTVVSKDRSVSALSNRGPWTTQHRLNTAPEDKSGEGKSLTSTCCKYQHQTSQVIRSGFSALTCNDFPRGKCGTLGPLDPRGLFWLCKVLRRCFIFTEPEWLEWETPDEGEQLHGVSMRSWLLWRKANWCSRFQMTLDPTKQTLGKFRRVENIFNPLLWITSLDMS